MNAATAGEVDFALKRPLSWDLQERFWARVDKRGPRDCWPWTLSTTHGYGQLRFRGRRYIAHRLAYELACESIPEGLSIDHLCFNRLCCNPAHLEPVTLAENTRRQWAAGRCDPGRMYREKTHCPSGHPYAGDNLRIRPDGARACRACARAAYHRWKAKVA